MIIMKAPPRVFGTGLFFLNIEQGILNVDCRPLLLCPHTNSSYPTSTFKIPCSIFDMSYGFSKLKCSSPKFWREESLRSAAPQRSSFAWETCGTITHFIRAALAEIIPLNESSKQIHSTGLAAHCFCTIEVYLRMRFSKKKVFCRRCGV
jgi:hypothetical protein